MSEMTMLADQAFAAWRAAGTDGLAERWERVAETVRDLVLDELRSDPALAARVLGGGDDACTFSPGAEGCTRHMASKGGDGD